jgi:hypothetical protein
MFVNNHTVHWCCCSKLIVHMNAGITVKCLLSDVWYLSNKYFFLCNFILNNTYIMNTINVVWTLIHRSLGILPFMNSKLCYLVSNLFWSREYNSAKEMCKYPSFSKVGGNYPLDLKIIWSSVINKCRMQVKCISLFNLTRLCHVY